MELLLAGLLIAIAGTAVAAMRERHEDEAIPIEIEPDPFEDHPMHCKCYFHN